MSQLLLSLLLLFTTTILAQPEDRSIWERSIQVPTASTLGETSYRYEKPYWVGYNTKGKVAFRITVVDTLLVDTLVTIDPRTERPTNSIRQRRCYWPHGPYVVYHFNGKLREEGTLRSELALQQKGAIRQVDVAPFPVGECKSYHPNGKLAAKVQFTSDGLLEGPCKLYYDNGRRKATGTYELQITERTAEQVFEDRKLVTIVTRKEEARPADDWRYYQENGAPTEAFPIDLMPKIHQLDWRIWTPANLLAQSPHPYMYSPPHLVHYAPDGKLFFKAEVIDTVVTDTVTRILRGSFKELTEAVQYGFYWPSGAYATYYPSGLLKEKGQLSARLVWGYDKHPIKPIFRPYVQPYRVGTWKTYYRNGSLQLHTQYNQEGLEEGMHKAYYNNGKLKEQGSYVIEQETIETLRFDPDTFEEIIETAQKNKSVKADDWRYYDFDGSLMDEVAE